jgi:hypothetical protein
MIFVKRTKRSRNWNSMRQPRLDHLDRQYNRYKGTDIGEAFRVALYRATGYGTPKEEQR